MTSTTCMPYTDTPSPTPYLGKSRSRSVDAIHVDKGYLFGYVDLASLMHKYKNFPLSIKKIYVYQVATCYICTLNKCFALYQEINIDKQNKTPRCRLHFIQRLYTLVPTL